MAEVSMVCSEYDRGTSRSINLAGFFNYLEFGELYRLTALQDKAKP
jgi:hypothetical protein